MKWYLVGVFRPLQILDWVMFYWNHCLGQFSHTRIFLSWSRRQCLVPVEWQPHTGCWEQWWWLHAWLNSGGALPQQPLKSVSHPFSLTSLCALSSSGLYHSYLFSMLELFYFHPSYTVTWRNLLCCYQIENKARILDHSLDDPPDIAIQRKHCWIRLKDERESEQE